ncbi:MAG: AfsR/SARP family transcriptional regulator [Longimicrobiales bacterium]
MTYVLCTLGALDLRAADNAVIQSVLGQPKRAALLCYLAASQAGMHARDTLVGMFWSELDHEHARNALSAAVHFLRRSLGRDAILNRNSDELALNDELVSCDVMELERMLERGMGAVRSATSTPAARVIDRMR